MELPGDGDACSKLTELPELPRDHQFRLTRRLMKVRCFLISPQPCYDQTFNKCLPEQTEAADPKEEEEGISSPEEEETCEMKEEKRKVLHSRVRLVKRRMGKKLYPLSLRNKRPLNPWKKMNQ